MGQKSGRRWDSIPRTGLPTTLLINGESWGLVRVDSMEDYIVTGTTYCTNHVITYLAHQSVSELRTTLWHEVFHAGACAHGGDEWWNSIHPTRNEHIGVNHLADFLSDFSRANREFMRWMQD